VRKFAGAHVEAILPRCVPSTDFCDMSKALDLEVDAEDVFKLLDPRDQKLMLD